MEPADARACRLTPSCAGTHTLQLQLVIATKESSLAALAVSAGDFSFSTCLFTFGNIFPTPRTISTLLTIQLLLIPMHIENLERLAFDGKRFGIFQCIEQFSDIVRFLNFFLSLRFPGSS